MEHITPQISLGSEVSQAGPVKKERKKLRLEVLNKVKRNLGDDFEKSLREDENARDGFESNLVMDDGSKTFQDGVQLCMFHLGGERYVVAQPFNGKMLIHIREYGMDSKRTVRYPTKRGIALDLEKFKKMAELCHDDVNRAIEDSKAGKPVDYRHHLGSNIYVTVQSGWPSVNIRKWFLPKDAAEVVPTRKGMALTFEQWSFMKGAMDLVKQLLREQWDKVIFCEFSEDHQNQLGFLRCSNCNPNEYMCY